MTAHHDFHLLTLLLRAEDAAKALNDAVGPDKVLTEARFGELEADAFETMRDFDRALIAKVGIQASRIARLAL